ncbi:gluconolactonase [Novosphingobium sp. CF614]|uniref:SMP-30/gluconolactonase/LRE family protein n=1 Tax=Novosphingobium sp. CF614 TaxID=1884364 RepID=UPI0008ED255F|nr:SMP-30/gluconolactonase/LRE family protein [Novosphingobium sp. CF614]SFF98985.1 gluconolactonase [Novosphingobium sp. CF614]
MQFEIKHVLDIKAELAESPSWSVEQQALYWVDIENKTFNRFDPGTGRNERWPVPATPGCFNFREGGGAVLATNEGFFDFDFTTNRFEKICDAPFDSAEFRFNDGKADRQGRLWAGTIRLAFKIDGPPEGTFYRYEAGKVVPVIPDVMVPNGTAFSPDGRTMYRSDWRPEGRIVLQYDYDAATGTPSNERLFATMPEGFGIPDGATVDTDGFYWAAIPYGDKGRVARFAPDGRLDLHFEMPVLGPTMVAFGGKDMSTLFITSCRLESHMGLPVSPLGGDIFAVETHVRGIAETLSAKA